MKIINHLIVISFLIGTSFVYGQDENSKTTKRISIQDISIQTGLVSNRNTIGTLTDFKELAPQSVLLNNDLTAYSSGGFFTSTSTPISSILFGIQFSDKQRKVYKTNPKLRIGLSYFSGTSLTGSLYKNERKRYDTLTSNQTGQVTYIDSTTDHYYNMNYTSEQLRFDGSLIFRTNPQNRWSLYTGLGFTAGISFNAQTEISYDKINKTEVVYATNTPSQYYGANNFKSERYRSKNNFGFLTYLPMGIDFRIGNKREFWKQIHLFYELRPLVNVTSIPELRSITNIGIQNQIGLRVSWNNTNLSLEK